ncbi:MAG: hypothetical protein LBI88_03095 [Deltaproteobacteria bacterium]|jgi:hypothetical protein|nr:hypothetical protein [Deltaproteobacteria bacterium]
MLACFCAGLLAMPAHAAASAAQQKTRPVPSTNATKPGWSFQAPDRSAQDARWRESISATLQQTTFAPSAPAGRYLQHNATMPGKRLPPARLDDLDTMRPPERKQRMADGKPSVHGEFTKHSTSWRPQHDPADTAGATPALREERRAGAYADFHPAEDVELKLGPEYHLGTSTLRPDQTGHSKDKDNVGAFGMGMKLKIDF